MNQDLLKKVTESVFKELLKQDVVLPSEYSDRFLEYARKFELVLGDQTEALEERIREDLKQLSELQNKTSEQIDEIQSATKKASQAIEVKDSGTLQQIVQDFEVMKSEMEQLKKQLYTDTLTQAYNRKWLFEGVLDDHGNFEWPGIISFIDLNKFKQVNDTFGHITGDKVLEFFTSYLRQNLKNETGSALVRYAGDEFLVLFRNYTDQYVDALMVRLQDELSRKWIKASGGKKFRIGFAYGLAEFEKGQSFHGVIEVADQRMYENKISNKAEDES